MKAHHRERELKFEATNVSIATFKSWCFSRNPDRYEHVNGPDTYYTQGKNVLRHRQNGGAGELTVKRRTSTRNTTDRLEIDLRFSAGTATDDVTRFLKATGWNPLFTVTKDCHIFWFEQFPGVETVLYDVECSYPNGKKTVARRFVEVEIHKEHSNHVRAAYTLRDWKKALQLDFGLEAPVNQSLYEIFSGQRYQLR